MINNLKNPNRKKKPDRFLKDFEAELRKMVCNLTDKRFAKGAWEIDPGYFKALYILFNEILGQAPDMDIVKDLITRKTELK